MKKQNIQSLYFIYSINSNCDEFCERNSKINNLVINPINFQKIVHFTIFIQIEILFESMFLCRVIKDLSY
jgi:hypothetical protein